ncbi:MAG: phage holin family protein [Shewanella sp.]
MDAATVLLHGLPVTLALIVLVLAVVSGLASYVNGLRTKQFEPSFLAFIGEMASSVVAGLTVLFFGAWQNYPPALTCLVALAAANNGKEVMALVTQVIKHKIKSIMGGTK